MAHARIPRNPKYNELEPQLRFIERRLGASPTVSTGGSGIQPAHDETTTTISPYGVVNQFASDGEGILLSVVGDLYPQIVIPADGETGIYLGNGTYDPYSDGANIYISGHDFFIGNIDSGGTGSTVIQGAANGPLNFASGTIQIESIVGKVFIAAKPGLSDATPGGSEYVEIGSDLVIDETYSLGLTSADTAIHRLTVSNTPELLLDGASLPGSSLAVSDKSANYVLANSDDVINFTASGKTLTFHNVTSAHSKVYRIKNSSAGNCFFDTTTSQTVDGATTGTITPGQSIAVCPNGAATAWIVV